MERSLVTPRERSLRKSSALAGLVIAICCSILFGGVANASTAGPQVDGYYLYSGSIWSPGTLDGKSLTAELKYQGDGNLVLYCRSNGKAIWASNTAGAKINASLNFQSTDGNMVIYANGGTPVWTSWTNGHPGDYAVVQNDSNFVIYDGLNPIWATGTYGKC